MDKLCEEILDKKKDGEILFFTDGNAKINILNEGISRNGRLLLNVIDECELDIINLSDKCRGKITRLNREKTDEKSAIDFVFASQDVTHHITDMLIDEEENYLLKGKAPTDHNSIIVKVNISEANKQNKQAKIVKWNLKAPENLWAKFDKKLRDHRLECSQILQNADNDIDSNYEIWTKRIERFACETIGKTTINSNKKKRESKIIRELRAEKRLAKKESTSRNKMNSEVSLQKKTKLKQKKI